MLTRSIRFVVTLLMVGFSAVLAQAVLPPPPPPPTTADVVYGQLGSFTTNFPNQGGLGANSLHDPDGLAVDSSGNLYVSDQQNSRVLYYPAGSTTATRVYGQMGSFTCCGGNNGGISANSLNGPYGIALDSNGNLYVADYGNNRVLYYPAGSTTATRVYGQGGSFTTNTTNNGGISANSLDLPTAVALDSSGNLYVADQYNNRVLFYPSGSTTATRVYGQGGSFSTGGANKGGISANSLAFPTGLAVDSSGNLYVADGNNSRVLFYLSGSTTATGVYGQLGSFTTGTANNGGVSANSLENPAGLTLDSSGNLYVADAYNNRVLFYLSGSTTATRVYGQLGSFTTSTANNGGISATSLNQPWAVALDSSGNFYVADLGNNRVLMYPPTTTPGIYGPVNGSTLTGNSAPFWWAGYPGATAYWLDVGSTSGGNNYYQSQSLSASTFEQTVNSLPSDGSTVYATWWYFVGGSWSYIEYQYNAFGTNPQKGVITSPAPTSTLTGSSVAFTWTAGAGATGYWIDAGSSAGGNQYFQSGNLGNVLTTTVPGLPVNGSTVYVTLYSLVNGQWLNNQYTYTAYNAGSALGVMQTPIPGSTLSGNVATFTWSAGSGASAYWMDVGSTVGGNNYYQSGNLGNVLTTTVYSLPADGSQIYVTLWSLVGGQWYYNEYHYTSGP
jgi:sugar lactone lactonase YvrE